MYLWLQFVMVYFYGNSLNMLWTLYDPQCSPLAHLQEIPALIHRKNNPSLIVRPKISSEAVFWTYAVTVPFKCHLSIITVAYVGICEIVQRMHAIFGYTVMA